MKRWLANLNLGFMVALLFFLFIMVNFIGGRHYKRWDVSSHQISALSEQTERLLANSAGLPQIIVFYSIGDPVYPMLKDLIDEYTYRNRSLRVTFIDPEQDPAQAQRIVNKYSLEERNVVIVSQDERYKILAEADLVEYDYTPMTYGEDPRIHAFKAEDALTSALIHVSQDAPPTVWFTKGHGEHVLDDAGVEGLTTVKQSLTSKNNIVEAVTLVERTEIPKEVTTIVIAGPTRRFLPHEIQLLRSYLEDGGKLCVLIDPLTETGLEGLLAEWGIGLAPDIVVDPSQRLPFVSASNVMITTYTQHPIVSKMKTLVTLFPLIRSVLPIVPAPKGIKVDHLALTSPEGWGETSVDNELFEFNTIEDVPGPVTVAAAVEQEDGNARIVVIGDSDFITNAQVTNVGNRDFFQGSVLWLLEQEHLIGISPKPLEQIQLQLTEKELNKIQWLGMLGLPVCFLLAGLLVTWRRRIA